MPSYKNGNYWVNINPENGDKLRYTKDNYMEASRPESMDIKITGVCNAGCPFCFEDSNPQGKHGDIMGAKFIDTLLPYTELAIGGGNPLEHPDLEAFLYKCKDLKLIPSMTVNQRHFIENIEILRKYRDEKLIYGLGVSITQPTIQLIEFLKEFPNAVCHVINGIITHDMLMDLGYNNLKLLILGYKVKGRGENVYKLFNKQIEENMSMLEKLLPVMMMENWFQVISFDNRALDQLNVKDKVSEEIWEERFMGNDGVATFFIDLVKEEFTVSSTKKTRWPLMDNVTDMFEIVKKNKDCE